MPTTDGTACPRERERAISMIEMIVVLCIIAVIMTFGIMSVRNSRNAGRLASAMSAANSYGNAIERFARDHRGRFPGAPGSADWPTTGAHREGHGPASAVLGDRHYYLRTVPEAIQDGTVTFNGSSDANITYRQLGGGAGYELRIVVTGRPPCAVRGGTTSGASSDIDCGRR